MEIPLFLAMTAAEFQGAELLPEHPVWMSCHFSSYGIGISNIPRSLPAGTMLMLNDRTPICGHDPETVAKTLCNTAQSLKCDSILLDFQREGFDESVRVIDEILKRASCPVGVSPLYAGDFDCPVLVPPVPPHTPIAEALSPWKDRELWLELSAQGTAIAVTEQGSSYTPLPDYVPAEGAHHENTLHCHYEITAQEDQVLFRLGRTGEDQLSLLEAAAQLGVSRGLGLWQEMNGRMQR